MPRAADCVTILNNANGAEARALFYFYSHETSEPAHIHVDRDNLSRSEERRGGNEW